MTSMTPTTATTYEPKKFTKVQKLEQDIKNLQKRIYSPKVDLIEKKDSYRVRIELPGVKSDTVKVQIKEQRIALISCKKEKDELDENDNVIYREARYDEFMRRVKLPGPIKNIDFDNHHFVIDNGVLVIDFPKSETEVSTEATNWADA